MLHKVYATLPTCFGVVLRRSKDHWMAIGIDVLLVDISGL